MTMDDTQRYYLLIDTSTEVCTVALGTSSGKVIAERRNEHQNKHAEALAPMVDELLRNLPEIGSLAGVGIAEGPGSYTGLRIGAAYAKGLCWTWSIPLVTVSTPELLTLTYRSETSATADLYMPMIDARRMEVYAGIYDNDYTIQHDIQALILTDDGTMTALSREVGSRMLLYFGSGAAKATEIMTKYFPRATYGGSTSPNSGAMLSVVTEKIEMGATVDIAYWEPYYLKEYEAKTSTNKVLREIIDK